MTDLAGPDVSWHVLSLSLDQSHQDLPPNTHQSAEADDRQRLVFDPSPHGADIDVHDLSDLFGGEQRCWQRKRRLLISHQCALNPQYVRGSTRERLGAQAGGPGLSGVLGPTFETSGSAPVPRPLGNHGLVLFEMNRPACRADWIPARSN